MSVDPAIFRAMVANGATPEMLLAVVEAAAAVEEEKKAKKRAGNAERQQRFRDRNADNALRDVTERDDVSPPSPSSPNENNLTPSTHTPGNTPRARKGSASSGCRLPSNWQPQPLTGSVGDASAAWPPGSLERELERFRDWAASATGPNARKSDWQAAWRNWIRKAEDEGRYRNGAARRNCGTAASRGDGFGNALREMSGDWGTDYRG